MPRLNEWGGAFLFEMARSELGGTAPPGVIAVRVKQSIGHTSPNRRRAIWLARREVCIESLDRQ